MTTTNAGAAPSRDLSAGKGVSGRSIKQTFDLLRAAVDDPSLLEEIPDGVTLILLPEDDPELEAAEIEEGLAALRRGEDVYFRHVRPRDRAA